MATWQFITFTVLLGALVALAGIIARKLGLADARLSRIEEALVTKRPSVETTDTPAVEAPPEVANGKEVRGAYLTLRDLRARSEQSSSPATGSSGWNFMGEGRESSETPAPLASSSEPLSPPAPEPVSQEAAKVSLEGPDVPTSSTEAQSPPSMDPVTEESAATILESPEVLTPTSEQHSPPADDPSSDDELAKKEREAALFLRNQRRRRRARIH